MPSHPVDIALLHRTRRIGSDRNHPPRQAPRFQTGKLQALSQSKKLPTMGRSLFQTSTLTYTAASIRASVQLGTHVCSISHIPCLRDELQRGPVENCRGLAELVVQ